MEQDTVDNVGAGLSVSFIIQPDETAQSVPKFGVASVALDESTDIESKVDHVKALAAAVQQTRSDTDSLDVSNVFFSYAGSDYNADEDDPDYQPDSDHDEEAGEEQREDEQRPSNDLAPADQESQAHSGHDVDLGSDEGDFVAPKEKKDKPMKIRDDPLEYDDYPCVVPHHVFGCFCWQDQVNQMRFV